MAVICDDEDCEEHPYQEGPAAELEAVTGYTGKGHIVHLDIKESETNAEERTGDGINDFEDSSDSGTILGLPDHHHRCHQESSGGLEILPTGTIKIRKEGDGHSNGSTEIVADERTKRITTVGLETDEGVASVEVTDPAVVIVPETAIVETEGEGGHGRIHIHERRERVTIAEEDEIGIVGVHGVHGDHGVHEVHGIHGIHGGHGIYGTVVLGDTSEDGRIGGVVVDDFDNSGTILVSPRHHIPDQWIGIEGQGPSDGVISWGVADDIPSYIQDDMIIGSAPEPVVYIPQRRTAIVEPPPRPIAVTVPQEPVTMIQPAPCPVMVARPTPQPIIAPPMIAPAPIMQIPQPQPQMLIRPQPQPVAYRLPPRAQVIQAPPAPVYQPIVQPPAIMALPPPQLPPPQVLYQPQPRAIVPAMVAPAPVVAPTYGTYETIVPGAVGGVAGVGMRGVGGLGAIGGGVATGSGMGGIGGRPYSVASIYDDQSVVSIYERENYDINDATSIYDERSIVSIDGVGHGPVGYGGYPYMAGAGVVGASMVGGGMVGGRALPGMAYGHHMVSAAHVPREGLEAQHQARHMEQAEYIDYGRGAEEYNRNHQDMGPSDLPRYRSEESLDELVEGRQVFKQSVSISERDYRRLDQNDDRMDVNSEILVENRHAAFASDSVRTDTSYTESPYQEIQLEEGSEPLQELAIETYYDTTKSQLKVRESQGRLLSEMAFQSKKRQEQDQERETSSSLGYVVPRSPTFAAHGVSSLSLSLQSQSQNQPPTLNIPKPPSNPPPVRLLVSRGVPTPLLQAKGIAIPLRSPFHRHSPTPRSQPLDKTTHSEARAGNDRSDKDSEPILSTSSKNAENIMLLARNQTSNISATAALLGQEAASKARSLISGSALQSSNAGSRDFKRPGLSMSHSTPLHLSKAKEGQGGAVAQVVASTRKSRRKQSIPPMSRNHLHPAQLTEGITACWNNEFGGALEVFKKHSTVYPRWSLAAAEVIRPLRLLSQACC